VATIGRLRFVRVAVGDQHTFCEVAVSVLDL
jgi:hypothetical protein